MDIKRITFEESVAMITTVVDSVFAVDKKTGKAIYLPENYDYSFRLCLAHYYHGYEITGDIDKDYQTAMNIQASDEAIDQGQLLGIQNAIKEKIDMRKAEINKSNIAVTSQLDDLMLSLMPVLEKLGYTINEKIAVLDTEKLNEKIENMYKENLVKAYMESSFADQNRNAVLDAKNEKIISLQNRLNSITGRNAFADKK